MKSCSTPRPGMNGPWRGDEHRPQLGLRTGKGIDVRLRRREPRRSPALAFFVLSSVFKEPQALEHAAGGPVGGARAAQAARRSGARGEGKLYRPLRPPSTMSGKFPGPVGWLVGHPLAGPLTIAAG